MRNTLVYMIFMAGLAAALPAQGAPHPRECEMSVGPDQMTFNAFQQQHTHENFCSHIPDLGPTVIILDAHQSELRSMNLEIRILRDAGQKSWNDDLDINTEFVTPAKKYLASKGSLSFDFDFKRDGKYIALVRALNDDGSKEYVGQYFFTVGETVERYMAAGAMLAASIFASFGIWRRGKTGR